MATRTTGTNRIFPFSPKTEYDDMPMIASNILYAGSAAGDNGSGYARPLVAGDPFAGFNIADVDNSGGANGAVNSRLQTAGKVVANVTGVTGVGDKDATVYMSDDDTFTLTSASNTPIGKISRHIGGTECEIEFEAVAKRSL